ncbi:MAG: hypothetical protein ACKO2G_08675 [Verrucomicrobiales bacterium]
MDRRHFDVVLAEFIEENPLACQGILSVATVVFTSDVPTLAVTLRHDPPRLLVNPGFLAEWIRSEEDLRAVLLHEFLHILLGHTKLFRKMDMATNIALDAVINHIVQRELGVPSGGFFRRFYQPESDGSVLWLLRPDSPGDIRPRCLSELKDFGSGHRDAWRIHELRKGLGDGKVLADDVLDHFKELALDIPSGIMLLGGHGPDGESIHPANAERLSGIFQKLDGSAIFRRPHCFGIGADPFAREWAAANPRAGWMKLTRTLILKLLVPHPRARATRDKEIPYCLPIANPRDRRAAMRFLWNPLLPEFEWAAHPPRPGGLVNVYLDVSGSMSDELDLLVSLLWQLRPWIRMPFHAFSNGVSPARFKDGKLVTETTGGTCFNDVLGHIAKHRPGKSLVITDGYIERPSAKLLGQLQGFRETIHVLVSSHGTTEPFEKHQIPATRLQRLPSSTFH